MVQENFVCILILNLDVQTIRTWLIESAAMFTNIETMAPEVATRVVSAPQHWLKDAHRLLCVNNVQFFSISIMEGTYAESGL